MVAVSVADAAVEVLAVVAVAASAAVAAVAEALAEATAGVDTANPRMLSCFAAPSVLTGTEGAFASAMGRC